MWPNNPLNTASVVPVHLKANLQNESGFTLLEMVIVIILIAILASIALERFWSLRVAAERVAIQQVVGNIRSALGMEVARYALDNRLTELNQLDGSNPMLLLAQQPTGYLGEIVFDPAKIAAGSWYFDTAAKTLNYHVNFKENIDDPVDKAFPRIHWRISLVYQDRNHNQHYDPRFDAINGLDLNRLTP